MRDEQSMQRRFERYLEGKEDALVALFDADRARVYDYVVRMTGDESAAKDTIDQMWDVLKQDEPEFFSLSEWRQYVLSSARTLNQARWNANTKLLENATIREELARGKGDAETLQLMSDMDKALQSLPGPEREVILLRYQNNLMMDDVKVVMDTTEEQALRWENSGKKMLGLVFGDSIDLPREIGVLPRHATVSSGGHSTQALSQMIANVKRSKPGIAVRWPIPALVLIGAGTMFFIVYSCR